MIGDLERRLAVAEVSPVRQAEPHRRRNAVARFQGERDRALAAGCSNLKAARLHYGGGGISAQALAILSGISRETLRKAEADPASVSRATLRRLATTLGVPFAEIAS